MLLLHEYVVHTLRNIHLILGTLLLGALLRRIERVPLRRWSCTLYGIFVLAAMLKEHFWHFFAMALLTIVVVLNSRPKECHVMTTALVLAYMTAFRMTHSSDIPGKYLESSLVLMVFSSKMSGVAFDLHHSSGAQSKSEFFHRRPRFWDLFHFAFCHVTLVSGSFYRYRTYDDFIRGPYSYQFRDYGFFVSRFVLSCVFLVAYTTLHGRCFPIHYISTEEFRSQGYLFITLYGMMQGLASRLWLLYLMFLGEFICGVTGFGVYPSFGDNVHGHGPTKNYDTIVRMSRDAAARQKCDLKTIEGSDLLKLASSPWIRDTVKAWNLTYQYWFSAMIYNGVSSSRIFGDRAFLITMAIDTLWHGVNPGFFLASMFMVTFMVAMRHYWELYTLTNGPASSAALASLVWLLKETYCLYFSLLCMLYHVSDIHAFFGAVYYTPLLFHAFVLIFGRAMVVCVKRRRKMSPEKILT